MTKAWEQGWDEADAEIRTKEFARRLRSFVLNLCQRNGLEPGPALDWVLREVGKPAGVKGKMETKTETEDEQPKREGAGGRLDWSAPCPLLPCSLLPCPLLLPSPPGE